MKLHLPKLLRVALLTVVCGMTAHNTQAATLSYTTDANGNKMYEIGGGDKTQNPKDNVVTHDGDLVLNSGDKLGHFGSSGNLIQYDNGDGCFVVKVTQKDKDTNAVFGTNMEYTGNMEFSNMLTVNGTLTLNGSAQLAIGGQYKVQTRTDKVDADGNVTTKGTASSYTDHYSALKADKVVVKGDGSTTNLQATAAIIGDLEVDGGKVSFHKDQYSGNSSWSALTASDPTSFKAVKIANSLTLKNNAVVEMGRTHSKHNNTTTSHIVNVFGSSNSAITITQDSGTFEALGYSYAQSGMTITQSGGTMTFRDYLQFAGTDTNTITQSGNASLSIGQIKGSGAVTFDITQSGSGSITLNYGASIGSKGTINITQTGSGTITLGGGNKQHTYSGVKNYPTTYAATGTYNISLTGSGTLHLYSRDGVTPSIKAGAVEVTGTSKLKLDAGTKLTTTELTLASGSEVDNNGTIVVGTTDSTTTGALNVTAGGKLNVTLDGNQAAINVGAADDSTNTVTGWTMAEGSTLGIGLTSDYFNNQTINDVTGSDNKEIAFEDILVANVAAGSSVDDTALKGTFGVGDVAGSDSRHWSVGTSTKLEKDTTGNVVLSGSLIYNPWIKVVEGGVIDESFSDTNAGKGLYTGLDISGADASLASNNSHTFGTKIDGVKVTLAHENALGAQPASSPAGTVMVETSGTSSLIADVENGKANLPGAIKNTGTLTMQGAFSASNLVQETVTDAYVDIDGSLAGDGDGFKRTAGYAYRVVTNEGTSASLIVGEGTSITIGGTDEYTLLSNGLAAAVDYTTYHINEALDASNPDGAKLSELMDASGNQLDTVEMDQGKLTMDADSAVEVYSTGGELVVEQGTVNGDLEDTKVTISGGEVGANIGGASSVAITGDTTISGNNDYSGATTIDGADVTLKNANALKGSPVTTKGESSLSTEGGVAAELAGSIQNEGSLTMSGTYTGSSFMTEANDSTRVCVDGVEGNNGFLREGTSVIVAVQNINGGTLTLDGSAIIKYNGEDYHLSTSGKAGDLELDHYLIADADHEVSMKEIEDVRTKASATGDVTVEMTDGVLLADAEVKDLKATGGTIKAQGAVIEGELSGSTRVLVESGDNIIQNDSGTNSHTGGTEIANGAKLKLGSADALGAGAVALRTGGILDLASFAVSNYINVTGCTLCHADAYTGNVDVSGSLNLDGNATANKVTMVNGGTITPLTNETLTVNTIEVVGADSTVGADLTVNPNGRIILNNGVILNLTGSLTLGNGATIVLHGQNYTKGSTLMTVNGVMNRTTGSVTLDYGFGTYALVGNEVQLMAIFNQNIADAMVQANWGMITGSRAFVHAVRGQRSNTGCIANGRGTAWAAVLGAYNDLDGGDISLKGAAVGADMKVGRRSTLGIALGYTDGEVSPTGLRDVDQEGSYLALYGEHALKKLSPTSSLNLDWVLAYGQTDSEYKDMKWDQDSLQVNSRLSWNKQINDRLGMRVFGGLEYFTSGSDTVKGIDTGSVDNLRGELGVGVNYVAWGMPATAKEASGLGCKRLVLHGDLRYFYDLDRSNPVVRMDGLSGGGENPGRSGVGVDAGATYRINDRWSASANYSFSTMEGSREHRVNVGASYTF